MNQLANTYTFQINGFTLINRGTLIVLALVAVAIVMAGLIVGWLVWRTAKRRHARPPAQ